MPAGRAPVSVGINPTMAVYTLVLGGACAVAAYTEKYRRDQDDIDDRLKQQYSSNMREQHAKIPQITQTIRGQNMQLDDTMNKWVWGGKASLPQHGGGSGAGNASDAVSAASSEEEEWDSGSSSSSEDDLEDEKSLSKKERRKRRKERKLKREERRKKRQEEMKRLEADRQKLVVQSVAAGAAVGAIAVAASMFLGAGRK